MPVSNPNKTVSQSALSCDGQTTVTLSFDAEAQLKTDPADIVLIMDRSGSTSGAPLAAAKAAAAELIRTVALASGSPDGQTFENGSRMALVSFADTATQDTDLTTEVPIMTSALSALSASGFTNHKAAFETAQTALAASTLPRKVVIMFTDGLTTVGGDASPVTEAMKQAGIEIYCIGLATDLTPLLLWASDPTATHVASTDSPGQLDQAFALVAGEVVRAGALDMAVRETLNPEFKITRVGSPSHGTVDILTPQTLEWKADTVGASAAETASLSFDIMHTGSDGGLKSVNQSVTYTDRDGGALTFPDPKVDVACAGPVIEPEPCPLPATFVVDGCKDAASVNANDTILSGLGRIVQVDAVIRSVCPGKQVAVAVILTELDADGVEHARGTKTLIIPPQTGDACQDIRLKCISFVVPEALDVSGDTASICNPRGFRTRVLANYLDTDFICCDPQTVII